MRFFWEDNAIVSLKLKDNLFTLGQMMPKGTARMRFYNLFKDVDSWDAVDLNNEEILFTLPVGKILIQQLGCRKVKPSEAKASLAPFERYAIFAKQNFDGNFPWKGGALIDLGENGQNEAWSAPILIEDLNISQHKNEILKYQLTNMWGAEDTAKRLIDIFECGVDRDYFKEMVFPGIYSKN